MPALCLMTPRTLVSLKGERLIVETHAEDGADAAPPREIALRDIDHMIFNAGVHITTPALAELMRRNIPAVLVSNRPRVLGVFHPPQPNNVARLEQYRRASDSAFALSISATIVRAKIQNSRRLLQRAASYRDPAPESVSAALPALQGLAASCMSAHTRDELRGIEGTAAGRYFEAYDTLFPSDCRFERRSRQPPHNAPNAILSYGYTILAAEMECRLLAAGLDPCIGFYHEPADRRASLALDLIEPFRAPLVDALALDLVNHGTVKAEEHFERRDGGVFLNVEGRKRFFLQYERRMTRDFVSEQTAVRASLRSEIERMTVAFKQSVLGAGPLEPFVMN